MTIKLRFTGLSVVANILWSLSFVLVFVLIFGLKAKAFMEVSIFGGIIILLVYLALTSRKLRTPRVVTFTSDEIILVYRVSLGMGEYEIVIPKNDVIVSSGYGISVKTNDVSYEIPLYSNRGYSLEEGPDKLQVLCNELTSISSKPIYSRISDYKQAILKEVQKMGYKVEGI